MLDIISKLRSKNFFHVFGSSFINQIISFASNFIIIRLIDKSLYGMYSYSFNIYSIFYLLSGLGLVSATLQLCSERGDTRESSVIFKYSSIIGVAVNIVLSLLIIIYSCFFIESNNESQLLLFLMAFYAPLSIIFEFIQVYFRYTLKNKTFSYYSTTNTFIILILSVIGSIFGQAYGLVIMRILGYIISIIVGVIIFKFPISIYSLKDKLSLTRIRESLSIGLISMVNISTGQLLYLLDVFIIGILIKDSVAIASYKVATLIPNALVFIPTALMTFLYPYFARNKSNITWVREMTKKTLLVFGAFNVCLVGFLIIFAPYIIRILFGEIYMDSVNVFRILILSYFFSGTVRKIIGNILVTQRQLKINLYIGIMEGVLNIVFNYILISSMGTIGAAYTTLTVTMISAAVNIIYINRYFYKQEI